MHYGCLTPAEGKKFSTVMHTALLAFDASSVKMEGCQRSYCFGSTIRI